MSNKKEIFLINPKTHLNVSAFLPAARMFIVLIWCFYLVARDTPMITYKPGEVALTTGPDTWDTMLVGGLMGG